MKVEGVGEIWEGVLERDPLSETFHLRIVHDDRVGSLDLQKMLEAYVGLEIRVVVSSLESLRRAAEVLAPAMEGAQGVTLEDLQQLHGARRD